MIRRPPRSTHCISSAASDVYKRQKPTQSLAAIKGKCQLNLNFLCIHIFGSFHNVSISFPIELHLCYFVAFSVFLLDYCLRVISLHSVVPLHKIPSS
eukprot:TRINITY_DN3723_c0_g1_i1.p3 TRINITY_DN3723_c0_g1~~TRINITY_DN3723_c0_g1_i1.p3  ORF type:complete len:105 (+),score=16.53 TRINITY_DN3723_c0_g1_i1:25-315(+)